MAAIESCLREIKSRHGMSMSDLAEHLEVHPETLTKLRAGRVAHPRFDIIAEIHRLAGHSLDALVGIENNAPVDLQVEQRLSALENQMKGVQVLIANGMLSSAGVSATNTPVPTEAIPRELRQGIMGAAKAGIEHAKSEGRGRGSALRERTAKREEEQKRTTRRKAG